MLLDPNQLLEARNKSKMSAQKSSIKSYISISKKQTPSGKSSKDKSQLASLSQNTDPTFVNLTQLNHQLEALQQENHDMDTDFKGWLKW